MNVRTRSAIIFPLALLSMLALVTFWVNNVVQAPTSKLDGSSRHDPDYIISNFVTTQTDVSGALQYKLAATEMKHFPDDDTSTLQRPRYTQFAADKPYTQVQGLRGKVSSKGEQVELFDNVKVTRQAFAEKGEMTVETNYLNILPNEEIVSTASPIIIRQAPKTVIYATGMLYEKKKRTVTLLHKVRAHYERPTIPAPAKVAKKAKTTQAIMTNKSSKLKATNKTRSTKPDSKTPNTHNARIRRHYE